MADYRIQLKDKEGNRQFPVTTTQSIVDSEGRSLEEILANLGDGGDTSAEEIYIGETEPTDENVKVWINPAEQGEDGGSAGGSGTLRVWMNTLGESENTPEQTTENIATYNALKKELNAIVFAVAKISVGIEGAPDIAVSYFVSQKQDTGESGIYMIIRDVIEGELAEMSFSLLPNGTILQ